MEMDENAGGPKAGDLQLSRGVLLDALLIAAGAAAMLIRPSPGWVERHFTNGYYPALQHAWAAICGVFPFAIGDLVIGAGAVLLLTIVVRNARRARSQRSWRPLVRMLLGLAAAGGFYTAWFYAGWGWGYSRAPLQTRVAYDAAHVNAAAIAALRTRAIAQMNRLAPLAHAAHRRRGLDDAALRAAWLPVVHRLGDRWTPHVAPAKPAIAGFVMDLNGTSGFTNPFTLETQLAPDLLWFERPFAQAHEWSHVAGFNRESEANYIAAVACLRSRDVAERYSGWLELFLYLPPLKHYSRRVFSPLVWRDFAAIRARNARFLNLNFSRFSWHVYDSYLKTNHVASGVANYDAVTRLFAGIPLDRAGLPEKKQIR